MITKEEVKLIIKYAPMDSCENISNYIRSLYTRKYPFLYELDYELEVTKILERASENYNPKLGQLIRYVKNTLSLKMKDYIKRNHVTTVGVTDTVVEVFREPIEEHVLSGYSDTTISAIYNVVTGKGTKKEKDLVNNIFKTEE